jgi:hypothetical protein
MRFPGSRETVEEKRRMTLPAAGTNPIHDPLHGQQGRAILGGWEKLGKGQRRMLLHNLGRSSLSVLHSRRVYQGSTPSFAADDAQFKEGKPLPVKHLRPSLPQFSGTLSPLSFYPKREAT